MRTIFALLLLSTVGLLGAPTRDGGYQRTPLTTNLAAFTSATHGQGVFLNIDAGGNITFTNLDAASGNGIPGGNNDEVQVKNGGNFAGASGVKIPTGRTNISMSGELFAFRATLTNLTAGRPMIVGSDKVVTNGLLDHTSTGHFQIPHGNHGFTTNTSVSTYVFTPDMSASQITNMVGTLPGDTLKWFTKGKYIIPTNNTTWIKAGVTNNFYFEPGTAISFGNSSDNTGTVAAPVPIFADTDGANSVLNVDGLATFVISNKGSPLLFITNANTKVKFRALDIIRQNTNALAAIIYQKSAFHTNDIDFEGRDIVSIGYDCYWNDSSAKSRLRLRARTLEAADSAIEIVGTPDNSDQIDVVVGSIKHYRQSYYLSPPIGNQLISFGDNFNLKVTGGIYAGTNAVVYLSGGGFYANYDDGGGTVSYVKPGYIETPVIQADPFGRRTPVFISGCKLVGTTVVGPEGFDAIQVGVGLGDGENAFFDNCRFVNATMNSPAWTNSIRSVGTNTAYGTFTFDGPVSAKLICSGNWSTTNTYDTTLTGDNQVLQTAGVHHMKVGSDNATAANRTFTLVTSTMATGQRLTLEWVGSNAAELVDDAAMSGGGNVRLQGSWIPSQYQTLTLEFNGTDLVEVNRGMAMDNSAWASGRGALKVWDGTAFTYLIGALSSDTPSNGQVPKWNTGGTITWEDDNNSGLGSGDSLLVNSTAISDSGTLTNSPASATAASTTFSVSAQSDPNPDRITVAIGAASATDAGIVTAQAQTLAGEKTFSGGLNAGSWAHFANRTTNDVEAFFNDIAVNGQGTFNDGIDVTLASVFRSTLQVLGDFYGLGNGYWKSLTATNGITNYSAFVGIGTNNAKLLLVGTNFGTHGWEAFTTGQTNLLKPNLTGVAAGDIMGFVHAVATAGPTNLITETNITTTGSGSVVRANGATMGSVGVTTNVLAAAVTITNQLTYILTTQNIATNSTVNSNLTVNVDLAALDLNLTNNISITNFSGLTSATAKTVTWWIRPRLVNRTIVYPALGTPGNAIFWRTNANGPMWTTLTNSRLYALSMEWRNTNVIASITDWGSAD